MNSQFVFLLSGIMGLSAAATAKADTAEVVLGLHQKVSMQELARSVEDPASPRYQKFYTPSEIRAIAAPSDADYQNLLASLQKSGVTVVSESATHLSLTVRGEKSVLAQLQSQLRTPFVQNASLATVQSITGLEPSQKRHPRLRFQSTKSGASSAKDNSGILPATIRKLYGLDSIYAAGITGKGQHIAIATYDGFYVKDVQAYYTMNNLSPGPSVDQVTFNGTPTYDPNSAAETQTDAEFSGMIAPGASIHVFASATNDDTGETQMFTAILDDNRAKVVNYSWGMCENQLAPDHQTAMDQLFARAVAQGVNIMVASGDSGSDCAQDGGITADFPASNSNVIAVGGTTLSDLNGLASETAWSGSGGGISGIYSKPSYQNRLDAKTFPKRAYPDVAFNADPNSGQPTWVHYDINNPDTPPANASYVVIGGTSIAAPQWSGFLALVGEARGSKALGSLHKAIYGIADADMNKYLNDVTSGSNGAYTAGAGFDAVTGWGSMQGQNLLTYLKSL
jgi:kumamolisin